MNQEKERFARLAELSAEELIRRGTEMVNLGRELLGQSASLSDGALSARLRALISDMEVMPGPGRPAPQEPPEEPERPLEEERSVGRFGVITHLTALGHAQSLGEFSISDFAAKLGLALSASMWWLTKLKEAEEVEAIGARYRCLSKPIPRNWVVTQHEPFAPADLAEATGLSPEDALDELEDFTEREIVRPVGESGLFAYLPPPAGPREHATRTPPERALIDHKITPPRGEPVRKSASDRSSRRARSIAGAGGIKGVRQKEARYKKLQDAKEKAAQAKREKSARSNGNGHKK